MHADFVDLIFVNERACLGMDTFVGQMNTYKLIELTPDAPYRLKIPIPPSMRDGHEQSQNFSEVGAAPPFMTIYQW
jgi:hypothetical protein